MPCIGQFQDFATMSDRLECQRAELFMPSTHHCSISSRWGRPVSRLLKPFKPTIKLLAPPGLDGAPLPDGFDGPVTASRSLGDMGANEKGSNRLPRSASGEPRVHSSQSRIPMTRGSVGWKIYDKSVTREVLSNIQAHQVIHLEVTVDDTAHTPLALVFGDLLGPQFEPRLELLSAPYLSCLLPTTVFRTGF